MNRLAVASMIVLAGASIASGQIVIASGTESATESGLNTAVRNAPRAYQAMYTAANFGAVTSPVSVSGMQLRLAIGENWRPAGYVGASWPDANINFADYEIVMARCTPALLADGEYLSTTPTFASYLSNPVVVRTGPLTIPANSFQADGGAAGIHSWGFLFNFSTSYTINPGDSLIIQIRHSGYGATGTPLNAFFASRSFQNGLTDAISSTASQAAAAPNAFSSPYFVNLVVPTPGAAALFGVAGFTTVRRRRA